MARRFERLHYAWVVAGITLLTLTVAAGMRAAPGVLLPALQADFGWSSGSISFAFGINLLLYGLIGPFAVAVMDRWGVRRAMLGSLMLIAGGAAVVPFMTAPWQLTVLWGLVAGLGGGVVSMVLVPVVAGRWFTARRGVVTGGLTAGAAAGTLLLLPVLAWIAQAFGWRAMVFALVAAVAALVPLVAWGMRDRPGDIGLAPYGEDGPPLPAPGVTGNPFRRTVAALGEGLRNRTFLLLAGSFVICGATTNGFVGTHLIPACIDAGFTPVASAGVMAGMGVFNVVGALASGWLSDRFDSRWLLGIYFFTRALALAWLPFSFDTPVGFAIVIMINGLDWVATVPPMVRLCAQHFGRERGSLMYGWINAIHQVGSGAAAFLGGVLRDHLGSYGVIFIAAGVICLGAVVMVGMVRRVAVEQ
ncbi:MAG: MFS transporter [Acetobacteraceae bacterium]|nr:MFS transporter [Acetobacteraceae bacterium]